MKTTQAEKDRDASIAERHACYGELVQIDGLPHDWFEGRAESCVLLVFIEDATGKLLANCFF